MPTRTLSSKGKMRTKSQDNTNEKIHIKPIRFIFICNINSRSEVNTFMAAASTIKKDYEKFFPQHRTEVHLIDSAKSLNEKLSGQADEIVKSIDFVGHGGHEMIGIMDEDNNRTSLMMDDVYFFFQFWFSDRLEVSDLDFHSLMKNVKIEIHGCKTSDKRFLEKNIAKNISQKLYNDGKILSYVIGHGNQANPGSDPKRQDYRHDARFIYHNGNIVTYKPKKGALYTIEKGHLSEMGIENAIRAQFYDNK